MQTRRKMGEGFEVDNSTETDMTFDEFAKMAFQKQKFYFGDRIPTVSEAEDRHWDEAFNSSSKGYAMYNDLSLFDDECTTWNLDKFTCYESMIHYKDTHEHYPVSLNNYSFTFHASVIY